MTPTPSRQIFQILLLEDNEADIYLLRQALEEAEVDCELTVIENGADGLDFATRQGKYEGGFIPDLAVLDLNLPKGGGEPVLAAIRQNEELRHVPVVVMSSSAAPREQSSIKKLGVECFITKPLELDAFLQIGFVLKDILLKRAPPHAIGSL